MGDSFLGRIKKEFHKGKCCNSSDVDQWALVAEGKKAGKWVKLEPGECVGGWFTDKDCEGMTCGGGFYKVPGWLYSGTCRTPGKDRPPFDKYRWTPDAQDANAESPTDRGSGEGNTPPGYTYGPRNP